MNVIMNNFILLGQEFSISSHSVIDAAMIAIIFLEYKR